MSASCTRVPGTIDTYRIEAGGLVHVGWIRLSRGKEMRWVARGLGTERSAAAVRELTDKLAAVTWLCEREPVPASPSRARAVGREAAR